MTPYFRIGWSDVNQVGQFYAEFHADYGDMVKLKTGRKISIWRTFVLQKGNSYVSAVD